MPAKNSLKVYIENGFYHLYNRGVEKRPIFLDDQDYRTFLYFLKKYLSPVQENYILFKQKSLFGKIRLLGYCLMPNHFHLLVKQKITDGITKLIRVICTNYSMYFNKRYKRNGTLFQGKYRAVLIKTDEQLLHVSRYIHLNPLLEGNLNLDFVNYPYSSYQNYLGSKEANWLDNKEILLFFKKNPFLGYKQFVEEAVRKKLMGTTDKIATLTLEVPYA